MLLACIFIINSKTFVYQRLDELWLKGIDNKYFIEKLMAIVRMSMLLHVLIECQCYFMLFSVFIKWLCYFMFTSCIYQMTML